MATQVETLNADAFGFMVIEHKLNTWSAGGFRWAGMKGKDGWILYRTFEDWGGVPISVGATANAAAGADPPLITVPVGKRWLFLGAMCSCVTDANVATRYAFIEFKLDAVNDYYTCCPGAGQAASLTRTLVYGMHPIAGSLLNNVIMVPIPSMGVEMPAGATVEIDTINIQVGDDYSVVRYYYKEVDVP